MPKNNETESSKSLPVKKYTPKEIKKILAGANLFNNDVYCTLFLKGNRKCVRLILRIVMKIPDLEIVSMRTQEPKSNPGRRSARLDVVAKDTKGRLYNIEIQSDSREASVKRARFHGDLMDVDSLPRGAKFDQLPETYIIFITKADVFGEGDPIYYLDLFRHKAGRRCKQVDNGMHILYVNGSYKGDDDIGYLMHDFSCNRASDMYFKEMADTTRGLKEAEKGVKGMMTYGSQLDKIVEKERKEIMLENIKKLMKKLKVSAKEAMDLLDITPKDQKAYLPMLKKG